MERNDKVLLEAHCAGDGTAFGELLSRHGPGLLGYLSRMTGSRDTAEDLFQETFMRVHEKGHTLKTDKFKSWLYQIATRAALNRFRRDKTRKIVSLDTERTCEDGHCSSLAAVLPDQGPGPDQAMELDEQKEKIRQAIDSLPPNQRTTLLLAYYHKMNYSEVAQVVGCSQGTVKTHMFRALKTLATLLPDPAGGKS